MQNLGRWVFALSFLTVLGCGQEVKMVEMDPTTIELRKTTQSRKIKVVAKDIRDAEVPNIPFTFSSENSSVATVDSNGVVKPTGDGNVVIVAKAPNGTTGETFVKVCLPQALTCDPNDKLELKTGLAAPIKCQVTNCKGEPISGALIEYTAADTTMLLKEEQNIFIGLKLGDTTVSIKALGLEHKVKVHVDEQTFLPGMGPGSGGGGKRRGGGNQDDDPYGKGRFDHILKNMNFKE